MITGDNTINKTPAPINIEIYSLTSAISRPISFSMLKTDITITNSESQIPGILTICTTAQGP